MQFSSPGSSKMETSETDFFGTLAMQNDQISYVKHALAPLYVFFTLFGCGGGGGPKGAGPQPTYAVFQPRSSKMAVPLPSSRCRAEGNRIYRWENVIGLFLVHKLTNFWVPDPPLSSNVHLPRYDRQPGMRQDLPPSQAPCVTSPALPLWAPVCCLRTWISRLWRIPSRTSEAPLRISPRAWLSNGARHWPHAADSWGSPPPIWRPAPHNWTWTWRPARRRGDSLAESRAGGDEPRLGLRPRYASSSPTQLFFILPSLSLHKTVKLLEFFDFDPETLRSVPKLLARPWPAGGPK